MILGNEDIKKIAICGAEEPLGRALTKSLQTSGVEVLDLDADDLRAPAPTLGEELEGVDGIVNMFGEPYVAKWRGRYEFDIYRSRLVSIRSLGTAMMYMKRTPRFFITVSNAMVYDKFEVHDEYSMSYGETLMSEVGQMETKETMKVAKQTKNVRVIIARMGYLMSREGGAYPLLEKLAKIGWGGRVDDGYQCLPMIYEDDAVRAILHLASDERSQGIYNLTLPEMASMNELVGAFSEALGKNQHRLPKVLIKMFAGRAFNLLEQNCKVLPSRLTAEGFEFLCDNVKSVIMELGGPRLL